MGAGPSAARDGPRNEASPRVHLPTATKSVADTLGTRQEISDKAPDSLPRLVHGWLEGIDVINDDPQGLLRHRRQGPESSNRTPSPACFRLEAPPYADNRAVQRATGGKAHYETCSTRLHNLAQGGAGDPGRSRPRTGRPPAFLQAHWPPSTGQKVEEPKLAAKAPSEKDRAIIHKQIRSTSLRARTRSWPILPLLDALARPAPRQHLPAGSRATRDDIVPAGNTDAL